MRARFAFEKYLRVLIENEKLARPGWEGELGGGGLPTENYIVVNGTSLGLKRMKSKRRNAYGTLNYILNIDFCPYSCDV